MIRTTVEMTSEQRDALLTLASERGERGFSRLVQEAIDLFLATKPRPSERRAAIRAARGSFKGATGRVFADSIQTARRSWDR